MRKPIDMLGHVAWSVMLLFVLGCADTEATPAPEAEPVVATAQTPPPADPADVESPEAIVKAVYDVISGGPGVARDWDRWRTLFWPGARLVPTAKTPDGEIVTGGMTPEDFVQNTDSIFTADGFFEIEIGSTTEQWGNLAHRFSSYASYRTAEDEEPYNRGINSFQLLNDGERWWVVTIFWQHEPDGGPIPDRYLDPEFRN